MFVGHQKCNEVLKSGKLIRESSFEGNQKQELTGERKWPESFSQTGPLQLLGKSDLHLL